MGTRGLLVVGGVMLSVVWTTAAYNYDQYTHEQIVAEASAQCADLDGKHEEYECRRSWRAAIERRLPLPNISCQRLLPCRSPGWRFTLAWC